MTRRPLMSLLSLAVFAASPAAAWADGMVRMPVEIPYEGSLQERSQEAILIFTPGDEDTSAKQDMVLKISVEGNVDDFAWVVPLPNKPETKKEDAELFEELHSYVQWRLSSMRSPMATKDEASPAAGAADAAAESEPVEVLSREVVGSYDVAVVRENEAGALNGWLKDNGYQPVEDGEDVIGFYREKGYVFACIKVVDTELKSEKAADLHPLRFSFETGGRDGIFFPMRLTGLQEDDFDVNLYVFYGKWINNDLSRFGYVHRGFELRWRDYDSRACKPNAGKAWSAPQTDPYLKAAAGKIPTVTRLFQKLHPGQRFYLTNIYATGLEPEDVRDWTDDLWLFPYYTDRRFVPYDAREGGPAEAAYPRAQARGVVPRGVSADGAGFGAAASTAWPVGAVAALTLLTLGAAAKVAGRSAQRR